MSNRSRASSWLYLWALVPVVLGFGLAAVTGFGGLGEVIAKMQRVRVPGEHALELARGPYTVYLESQSRVDGAVYTGPEAVSGLRCEIRDPNGDAVRTASEGVASYSDDGYVGRSLFVFEVDPPGAYTLRCERDEPAAAPVVLAVGGSFAPAVLMAVGFPVGGMLLGLIVFGLVLVYRRGRRFEP